MAGKELIAYLADELANRQQRLDRIQKYVDAHPSFSIQLKKIQGRQYYYRKFREGGKVKTVYVGPATTDVSEAKSQAERIRALKAELRELRKEVALLQKQLKLARSG